ncbi:MAG: MarC family protein [SAR202 cluster bacterium]|nr:MarC family protein [SAR202 cluster bacterium]
MQSLLDFAREFVLVFLPMFVAMDAIGTLPFVLTLTRRMPQRQRAKALRLALLTGAVIGLGFLGLGRAVFTILGITLEDFLIAGGLILLVLSLRELLSTRHDVEPVEPDELVAVVPIGTPLLVSPATISILLLLSALHPVWMVVLAFALNLAVAWPLFAQGSRIARFLGEGGLRAFTRVVYLLLAAIAVQLIRQGVTAMLDGI